MSERRTTEGSEVALVVGGGVGPEVIEPVLEILEAAGSDVTFQRVDVPAATEASPEDYLDDAMQAIRRCGVGLKTKLLGSTRGADWHQSGNSSASPNVELRRRLDLYAGVRPLQSQPGLPTRHPGLDLILVRESTEGIYKGIEHEVVPGVIQSSKVVTRAACERIARYAFELAREEGRSKVTFIHKANIMKRSDGLFRTIVRAIAEDYPDIEAEDRIVDAACMQMVLDPHHFDVILTGNLYGDILSALGSGLAGGISNSHGVNVGDELRVFEAIPGDAPSLVGTGTANPLPVLSAALAMLRHLERSDVADAIGRAIGDALEHDRKLTPDLGGDASTRDLCNAIIARLDG